MATLLKIPAPPVPYELPKVVCSWCSTTMREGVTPISHGLCDLCRQKHFDDKEGI